jgi:hypothetical protein
MKSGQREVMLLVIGGLSFSRRGARPKACHDGPLGVNERRWTTGGLMIDQVQSWHHDVDLITNTSDSTRHPSCPEQLGRRGRLAINRIITRHPLTS